MLKLRRLLAAAGVVLALDGIGVVATAAEEEEDASSLLPGGRVAMGVESMTVAPTSCLSKKIKSRFFSPPTKKNVRRMHDKK